MSNKEFFIAKIKSFDGEIKRIDYVLYATDGDGYVELIKQILDDYNKDCIEKISIEPCGNDDCGNGFLISESLADALIHDLSDQIICVPSDWRKNHNDIKPIQ